MQYCLLRERENYMFRSRLRKAVAGLCAAATALGLLIATPGAAQAAPIYPSKVHDKWFYVEKSKYQHLPHGHLLKTRSVVLPTFPGAVIEQMVFVSTNSHGKKITATASLLRQVHSFAVPNVPTLVYNHFINSLGVDCQPTYALSTPIDKIRNPEAMQTIAEITLGLNVALKKGWNILLPDFEGMQAAYGANILAGHISLDAVNALTSTKKFNSQRSPIMLAGYSGGAMATLFAAVQQPKYSPRPRYVGAVAGGSPVDMEWMGVALGDNPNPGFGIVVGSMIGLEREYPNQMNIFGRMKPKWKNLMRGAGKDACVASLLSYYAGQSFPSVFNNVNIKTAYAERKVARANSIINDKRAPRMPIFFYHGNQDIAVPVSKVKQLARRYCKAGTKVSMTTMDLSEHLLIGFVGLPWAAAYADGRFAGLPAPNDFCEGRSINYGFGNAKK